MGMRGGLLFNSANTSFGIFRPTSLIPIIFLCNDLSFLHPNFLIVICPLTPRITGKNARRNFGLSKFWEKRWQSSKTSSVFIRVNALVSNLLLTCYKALTLPSHHTKNLIQRKIVVIQHNPKNPLREILCLRYFRIS